MREVNNVLKFEGAITGQACKHFIKRTQKLTRRIIIIADIMILPFVVFIAISIKDLSFIYFMGTAILLTPFVAYIPMTKREFREKLPRLIYIEDGYITCVSEKSEETRSLDAVKSVQDWGEFYELDFYAGKWSAKFQCQKDLLKEGSLKEFEGLFEGKIIRR